MRSQIALTNAELSEDFEKVLMGHCFYLPNFFSAIDDYSTLLSLVQDLAQNQTEGMINWSRFVKRFVTLTPKALQT
jgi:hypothetical protein